MVGSKRLKPLPVVRLPTLAGWLDVAEIVTSEMAVAAEAAVANWHMRMNAAARCIFLITDMGMTLLY